MAKSGVQYEVDWRHFFRLFIFGSVGWIFPMAGMLLAATNKLKTGSALTIGVIGVLVACAISLGRSIQRNEPFLKISSSQGTLDTMQKWSEVANTHRIHANRWTMYADLAAWFTERDWAGRVVAEFGGTNEVLQHFMIGADYRLLAYPNFDVQDLHSVQDNTFDLAILDQTLEHVADPERALTEIRRTLKSDGVAIITTPFLVPVHTGTNFGDYYRWTPQGLKTALVRCGFEPDVRMWGGLTETKALLENIYLLTDEAMKRGLNFSTTAHDDKFPITVWAIAKARK